MMIFHKFAIDQAVEYTAYKFIEILNLMKSRSIYADIFLSTGSQPNKTISDKQKKKMGAI